MVRIMKLLRCSLARNAASSSATSSCELVLHVVLLYTYIICCKYGLHCTNYSSLFSRCHNNDEMCEVYINGDYFFYAPVADIAALEKLLFTLLILVESSLT